MRCRRVSRLPALLADRLGATGECMREDPKKFVVKKTQCMHLSDDLHGQAGKTVKRCILRAGKHDLRHVQRLVSGVNHYVVTINY
jgi:hypothetical protein